MYSSRKRSFCFGVVFRGNKEPTHEQAEAEAGPDGMGSKSGVDDLSPIPTLGNLQWCTTEVAMVSGVL